MTLASSPISMSMLSPYQFPRCAEAITTQTLLVCWWGRKIAECDQSVLPSLRATSICADARINGHAGSRSKASMRCDSRLLAQPAANRTTKLPRMRSFRGFIIC